MDLSKVLTELRQELADLDAAIASLEQLPQAQPKRTNIAKARAANGRDAAASAADSNARARDSA